MHDTADKAKTIKTEVCKSGGARSDADAATQ